MLLEQKVGVVLTAGMSILLSSVANGDTFSGYTWQTYGNHQYALTLATGTWLEMESEAVAVGGHLVTINNVDENSWLFSTFITTGIHPWIGLYQDHNSPDYSEPAGGWVWASGEPVTYTDWGSIEPTNSPPSEDYVVIAGDYGWNDTGPERPGWSPIYGIIEIVPEPATLSLLVLGGLMVAHRRRG